MSDFIFKISPNIVLGSYTSSRVGQMAQEWGSKFLVILDPILKESGTSAKLQQSLTDRKVNFFTYDEISSDSSSQTVENILNLARKALIHGIIAVGGSKTLNIAKAVSTLYNETHDIYTFLDGQRYTVAPLPLICMPTTMRDCFVFTDKTPVIDARSSKVKLLKNQNGLCKLCIFDTNLMSTLTEKQISSMSIETLCIAVEAYLSQKASFFSDMIIEKSLELLGYALDGATSLTITTPPELLLSQGGCMASLGSASSSLGTAYLIAMCVNSRYKISTFLTTAILFPYVIEDAAKFCASKLAKIARILKACTPEATEEEAVNSLTEYVRQHIAKANIPSRLKDLGLSIEQLSLSAEDAGDLELINTLPRSMTSDDLFDLIKRAY